MKKLLILIVVLVIGIVAFLYQPAKPLPTLKQQYTNERSHYIELNDLTVHYRQYGNGVPVLLIHGTSSSSLTWSDWQNVLAFNYTTYAIDMPGGGLTTPPADHDYSIDHYIEILDLFVDSLGLDSFYMAGNSLGGHIAWEYAVRGQNAEKLKKLILLDPSGFFIEEREPPLVFKMAQSKVLTSVIEYINVRPFVGKSLRQVYYNDSLVTKALIAQYTDMQLRKGNRLAFFKKVQGIEKGSVADLQKIKCPTLIQWGKQDEWVPLELAEIFTTNIPNNQLIVYDNCGHVPMEEKPGETVVDAMSFFNKKQ